MQVSRSSLESFLGLDAKYHFYEQIFLYVHQKMSELRAALMRSAASIGRGISCSASWGDKRLRYQAAGFAARLAPNMPEILASAAAKSLSCTTAISLARRAMPLSNNRLPTMVNLLPQ